MKHPQGLTNKIIFQNNIITKISRKEIDYYLDRKNEAKLYEFFLTLDYKTDFIIRPLAWGFNEKNEFYSQFAYIDNTYSLLEKPDFSLHNLKLIKQLIDNYHQLTPPGIKTFEPKKYLNKFRTAIKEPFFNLDEFEPKLEEVLKDYYQDNKKVFSHNDLTAGNFLFLNANEVLLIDYEYSMYNHYLFDYGSFITESLNGVNEPAFIELLNLSKQEKAKLKEIMYYQLILWINWCNYMFEIYQLPIYKTIAEQKYLALKNFK